MRCASFAAGYRLAVQTAWALIAIRARRHAALISVFTELTSARVGAMLR